MPFFGARIGRCCSSGLQFEWTACFVQVALSSFLTPLYCFTFQNKSLAVLFFASFYCSSVNVLFCAADELLLSESGEGEKNVVGKSVGGGGGNGNVRRSSSPSRFKLAPSVFSCTPAAAAHDIGFNGTGPRRRSRSRRGWTRPRSEGRAARCRMRGAAGAGFAVQCTSAVRLVKRYGLAHGGNVVSRRFAGSVCC